jgi:surface protein
MNVQCTGSASINRTQVTSISVVTGGPPATYNIKIAGQISNLQFQSYSNLKEIKSWGCFNISLSNAFTGCQSMTCTAVDSPRITATNLTECFNSCGNFNGAIGNWDTSTVTNMFNMFNGASSFNQNIGNWNVSNVTNMGYMFGSTSSFNQDIGNWDVSKVTNMELMFQGANPAFNQNIGGWNISQVANFAGFMQQKTTANFSTTNLDAIYNGWSSRSVQSNKSISFGTAKYTSAGAAGRAKLISTYGWTIVDGGQL